MQDACTKTPLNQFVPAVCTQKERRKSRRRVCGALFKLIACVNVGSGWITHIQNLSERVRSGEDDSLRQYVALVYAIHKANSYYP